MSSDLHPNSLKFRQARRAANKATTKRARQATRARHIDHRAELLRHFQDLVLTRADVNHFGPREVCGAIEEWLGRRDAEIAALENARMGPPGCSGGGFFGGLRGCFRCCFGFFCFSFSFCFEGFISNFLWFWICFFSLLRFRLAPLRRAESIPVPGFGTGYEIFSTFLSLPP
jgi:hypothetical protein